MKLNIHHFFTHLSGLSYSHTSSGYRGTGMIANDYSQVAMSFVYFFNTQYFAIKNMSEDCIYKGYINSENGLKKAIKHAIENNMDSMLERNCEGFGYWDVKETISRHIDYSTILEWRKGYRRQKECKGEKNSCTWGMVESHSLSKHRKRIQEDMRVDADDCFTDVVIESLVEEETEIVDVTPVVKTDDDLYLNEGACSLLPDAETPPEMTDEIIDAPVDKIEEVGISDEINDMFNECIIDPIAGDCGLKKSGKGKFNFNFENILNAGNAEPEVGYYEDNDYLKTKIDQEHFAA